MTNREIRFELAKVALTTCRHMTSESLSESIKNLYDWIIEEPEVVVEQTEKDDKNPSIEYDNKPIGEVISCISKSGQMGITYATKLADIFHNNEINTVGDLLRIGGRYFSKYRNVGKGSISRIDDALEELYGIKDW
jgi:DNA-directed RNA polymerase alpha subunit